MAGKQEVELSTPCGWQHNHKLSHKSEGALRWSSCHDSTAQSYATWARGREGGGEKMDGCRSEQSAVTLRSSCSNSFTLSFKPNRQNKRFRFRSFHSDKDSQRASAATDWFVFILDFSCILSCQLMFTAEWETRVWKFLLRKKISVLYQTTISQWKQQKWF